MLVPVGPFVCLVGAEDALVLAVICHCGVLQWPQKDFHRHPPGPRDALLPNLLQYITCSQITKVDQEVNPVQPLYDRIIVLQHTVRISYNRNVCSKTDQILLTIRNQCGSKKIIGIVLRSSRLCWSVENTCLGGLSMEQWWPKTAINIFIKLTFK